MKSNGADRRAAHRWGDGRRMAQLELWRHLEAALSSDRGGEALTNGEVSEASGWSDPSQLSLGVIERAR